MMKLKVRTNMQVVSTISLLLFRINVKNIFFLKIIKLFAWMKMVHPSFFSDFKKSTKEKLYFAKVLLQK
jgi:hypothetical protein